MMPFEFDDGGRASAGYKGTAGDCAARAIAIATGMQYRQVYDDLNILAKEHNYSKREKGTSSARNGMHVSIMRQYLEMLGWDWVPVMGKGTGCTMHVRSDELPDASRMILRLSKHYAAVVDGVLRDTYDSSREGTRCVYGYWTGETRG